MLEALSTKQRVYILKQEGDPEGYRNDLIEEKAKYMKELEGKQAKLEGADEVSRERLDENITTLELQIKAVDEKIVSIDPLKAFLQQYGPTQFHIKSIGRRRNAVLMTQYGIGKKYTDSGKTLEYMCQVVEENLLGWTNFRNKSTGMEIPFSKEEIDFISNDTFNELFNQITGKVDEIVAKNSELPPAS